MSQPTLADPGRCLKLTLFSKWVKVKNSLGAPADSVLCDVVEAVYGAIFQMVDWRRLSPSS